MRLILVAALVGLFIGLFGTPLLIRFLRRHGYAQAIRDESDGHYPDHEAKRGTPSMGGLDDRRRHGRRLRGRPPLHLAEPVRLRRLVLVLMTGLACVGFADDYIKIFRQRSSGLRASVKLGGQAVVAIVFGLLVTRFPGPDGRPPASQAISFVRDSPWVLPAGLFVVWVFLMVVATSNGVNLADGLDGLATGAVDDGARRLCRDRHLAVRQLLLHPPGPQVLRGAGPPRPRCGRRGRCGCLLRLPLVERLARPRSSWATPGPWRSGACWPGSRSCPAPSSSCSCSADCSSSSPCR